jgi:hypothetical protein
MEEDKEFIKPTIEQTAWVLEKICSCISNPTSFRGLIYDRLGYGVEAYCELLEAGGMEITNAMWDLTTLREQEKNRKGCDNGICSCAKKD